MKIDNDYKQRELNFGKLKSIEYGKGIFPDVYGKGYTEFMQAVKESKAFNKFFKQYDVDMFIKKDENSKDLCMILKTAVPKTYGNKWYPEINIVAESTYFSEIFSGKNLIGISTTDVLIDKLTEKIKKVTFLDLKSELDSSLRKLKEEENLANINKKYKAELDDITKSLLSSETEGKNIFVKLLAWLLDN